MKRTKNKMASTKVGSIEVYRGSGSIRIYLAVGERDANVFLEVGGPEIWWRPRKHVDPHNKVRRWGWLVFAVGVLP